MSNVSSSKSLKVLAPKLRFPEFTEAWEKCQLGSVCSKGEYGMNAASIKYNGRDKYIRISDIDDDTHQYIQDNPVSPDGITDTKYRVREDDILLARTGSVGKSYIYNHDDGNLYYAGFLIRFHVLPGNESQFIYYQTLLGRYRKWVARTSMRSIQPGINAKEYASYEIYMPSKLAEQKKIIKLFNCIDTRITTHTKLLTLLNMTK